MKIKFETTIEVTDVEKVEAATDGVNSEIRKEIQDAYSNIGCCERQLDSSLNDDDKTFYLQQIEGLRNNILRLESIFAS